MVHYPCTICKKFELPLVVVSKDDNYNIKMEFIDQSDNARNWCITAEFHILKHCS